ncbi:acetylcholinesterase-like [Cydia splendana]|uniref:acetylcholinesterase-like n=1 Tax=Cydia splendana TaxID=1100963 RepID=UPI00300D180A
MEYVYLLLSLNAVNCIDLLVSTNTGFVQGVSENGIASFMGIPYAIVDPLNQFGDTLEVPAFEGVYSAKDGTALCPQQDDITYDIIGTLDCLRINVYVPEGTNPDSLLPVMVFIHGGDFRRWNSNRGTYGPDFLVPKGVILVTFNYRLGPYGFMSLHRSDIPGNAGLRDQWKALIWVRDNIAAFGGDSDDITLFGEDAGAASVEVHILSRHSKGLFNKAILQSGSVLCDWAMAEPDINAPMKLAKYLGLDTDDVDDALNYLNTIDPKMVITASIDTGLIETFKPIVEQEFFLVKSMIRDKPSELLNGASLSIPIIIGFNSREEHPNVRYFTDSLDGHFKRANASFRAKMKNYFNLDDEDLDEAVSRVRYFYLPDNNAGLETIESMFDFDADFSLMYPSLRDSRYYVEAGATVYLYTFDYAGGRNYMKNRFRVKLNVGAIHGDEIGYLFQQSPEIHPRCSEINQDTVIINVMTYMWTDFAKTGNPTPAKNVFTWRPVIEEFSYALLGAKLQMIHHPYHRRMAFWDQVFETYGEYMKW